MFRSQPVFATLYVPVPPKFSGAEMLFLLLALACSTQSTELDPTLFNQSCGEDADCVAVRNGDACGCSCADGAIHVSELGDWRAYYDKAFAACDPASLPDCAACYESEAFCENGFCESRPVP